MFKPRHSTCYSFYSLLLNLAIAQSIITKIPNDSAVENILSDLTFGSAGLILDSVKCLTHVWLHNSWVYLAPPPLSRHREELTSSFWADEKRTTIAWRAPQSALKDPRRIVKEMQPSGGGSRVVREDNNNNNNNRGELCESRE